MGIAKLSELIKEEAPEAVRPASLEQYRGRVVALDASVAVHQFRAAAPPIVNRHGQNISSLQGLFFRTLHLLENGLKPVFVFDGKPPELKRRVVRRDGGRGAGGDQARRPRAPCGIPPACGGAELAGRQAGGALGEGEGSHSRRLSLQLAKRAAVSGARRGTAGKRLPGVPPRKALLWGARGARGLQGVSSLWVCLPAFFPEPDVPARPPGRDSETLLSYLGVPCVQAPAEAEATCAALVKSGHAWCAATEDMDALPFGAGRLLRHLAVKNSHLEEISLPVVLQKLGMTQEQFVDLCILLGCDYCDKIRGLGPKKALKLLRRHGSIEQVLRNTSREKHPVPGSWCLEETRRLFLQPEVTDPGRVVLEWKEPDEEGLVRFLAHEKCMKESRIRGRMKKWRDTCLKLSEPQCSASRKKGRPRKAQQTVTGFFPVQKRPNKASTPQPARKKQKCQELPEMAPGI